MITRRGLVIAAALGAGAFVAGFALSRWRRTGVPSPSAAADEDGWNATGDRMIRSSSAESPDTAPDFHFTDQHGAEHKFSDWHGSVRIVNFWGTWCPPCVHEIPVLIAVQESFRARGVRVVGVAVDEPDGAFAMAKELGMNYPTMADSRRSVVLLHAYGNRAAALPFTAFVDSEGLIRERFVGALTMDQAREKILALLS